MPLSEEELRQLEQMERALSAEDPKFASALRGTSLRRSQRRQAVLAGVVVVGGITLLMAGVISRLWVIGVIGFLVMLAATSILVTSVRAAAAVAAEEGEAGLMGRAGERWRHRHRTDDEF